LSGASPRPTAGRPCWNLVSRGRFLWPEIGNRPCSVWCPGVLLEPPRSSLVPELVATWSLQPSSACCDRHDVGRVLSGPEPGGCIVSAALGAGVYSARFDRRRRLGACGRLGRARRWRWSVRTLRKTFLLGGWTGGTLCGSSNFLSLKSYSGIFLRLLIFGLLLTSRSQPHQRRFIIEGPYLRRRGFRLAYQRWRWDALENSSSSYKVVSTSRCFAGKHANICLVLIVGNGHQQSAKAGKPNLDDDGIHKLKPSNNSDVCSHHNMNALEAIGQSLRYDQIKYILYFVWASSTVSDDF